MFLIHNLRKDILLLYPTLFLLSTGCTSENVKTHRYSNELIHESSPYLLQHAHNPVHWYPWGQKALEKAKSENKMLLVSIGYAACHWCHVMEQESFEDTAVARLMNQYFIPVKVDREERPDIDGIFMSACQLASQEDCGWPLNAFALPDGRPVWAGTYFPKKNWIEILKYFQEEWAKNQPKIEEYATSLAEGVQSMDEVPEPTVDVEFSRQSLDRIVGKFIQTIDFQNGGQLNPPKFPMPVIYQFLLNYHHFTGNEQALKAVTATLDEMMKGGIYDHLGGGFAWYATDAHWQIPHFEKMLYDNAQIVSLYAKAYQLTGKPAYREVMAETLKFIHREMTSPEGNFFSSFDADSEGEEGKFYVWQQAEIDSILGDKKMAAVFSDFFEVEKKGNWEAGKNILHRRRSNEEIAQLHGLSLENLEKLIADAKQKLFKARSSRHRPGLDDKSLTAWNALMLKGYTDAYMATGQQDYLDAALKNGHFILDKMLQPDHRLHRNYKSGKSVINAFLDDYALAIEAFTVLYQVTFDEMWLYKAKSLMYYVLQHFTDEATELFFYTSDLDPPLAVCKMELTDNVIPASNSVMAKNLYLLGLFFYQEEWVERSRQMLQRIAFSIEQTDEPDYYANWCQLYLDFVRPPFEVVIVGANALTLRQKMMHWYLPQAVFLGGESAGTLELMENKGQEGQTLIYVCKNKVCKLPVTEPSKAIELMSN